MDTTGLLHMAIHTKLLASTASAILLAAALAGAAQGYDQTLIMTDAQLFAALDAGDAIAARAFLHEDIHMGDKWRRRPCTLALYEVDGTSGLAVGRTASRALLDTWADAADTGAETRITNWVSDCHSGELSYATLEFERTNSVNGKQVTKRYVSTSLVTYEDGGWRITHMQVAPAAEKQAGSLALKTPGLRVARVKALDSFHPRLPCESVPGAITIVAVAATREEHFTDRGKETAEFLPT